MTEFTLVDGDQPMCETPVYKFLVLKNYGREVRETIALKDYLGFIGFNKETDTITDWPTQSDFFRYVVEHYQREWKLFGEKVFSEKELFYPYCFKISCHGAGSKEVGKELHQMIEESSPIYGTGQGFGQYYLETVKRSNGQIQLFLKYQQILGSRCLCFVDFEF